MVKILDRKDSIETVGGDDRDRICTKKVILISAAIVILLIIVITVPIVVSSNRSSSARIIYELLRKQPKTQTEFYEQVQALKKIREEELKPIMDITNKLKEELKNVKPDFLDGGSDECLAKGISKLCIKDWEVKYITYSELFQLATLLEPIKDKVNPKFEVQVLAKFMEYCEGYNIYWYDEGTFRKYLFLFRKDVIQMEKHNRDPSKKYKKGYHTRLAEDVAVTEQEMKKVDYDGLDLSKDANITPNPFVFELNRENPNSIIDWREGGYVTKIDADRLRKCNSPWVLAATAMYNAFYTIKTRHRIVFSAQQPLDCVTDFDRGDLKKAIDYFVRTPICFETRYPFTGTKDRCQDEKCRGGHIVKSIVKVDAGKAEDHLKKNGPFLTLFYAPEGLSDNYDGGLYKETLGNNQRFIALVVGFGTDPETKEKYWIAQPAWKTKPGWGEDGYFRIDYEIAKGSRGIFENAYGLSRHQA
ncbi:papain cysteine protease family protein [Theileria equi strain WA]|uniref:Papain cysteine protease family protein n=1 Tax=Theileria equi strain WA TaxID=1537102 RepID=L0B0J1_THEEQ|nr:papain cysteine protease family protein [Theileria equi strain WA]AFZ80654.1 papain cysteine protease family protein [Theileria equi strain WA]|eukprot:XP_004830320.1 papain cysteine protease family protein [Theileria equi strain WA]